MRPLGTCRATVSTMRRPAERRRSCCSRRRSASQASSSRARSSVGASVLIRCCRTARSSSHSVGHVVDVALERVVVGALPGHHRRERRAVGGQRHLAAQHGHPDGVAAGRGEALRGVLRRPRPTRSRRRRPSGRSRPDRARPRRAAPSRCPAPAPRRAPRASSIAGAGVVEQRQLDLEGADDAAPDPRREVDPLLRAACGGAPGSPPGSTRCPRSPKSSRWTEAWTPIHSPGGDRPGPGRAGRSGRISKSSLMRADSVGPATRAASDLSGTAPRGIRERARTLQGRKTLPARRM